MPRAKKSDIEYFAGDQFDTAIAASAGIMLSLENEKPTGGGRFKPGSAPTPNGAGQPAQSPSAVQPDLARYVSMSGDVMPWGDGNDFPQRIIDLYNRDPLIPTTLGKVAAALVGRGVMAVEEDLDDAGEEIVRAVRDPEINAFIKSVDFGRYLREMATDVAWYFNGFPEMILSKDRSKIVQLHPLNTEEVRWCRMTPEGNMPFVYLNANWPNVRVDDSYTKKIDALDPYRWDRNAFIKESAFYNFVYPISYPTPGKRFYSLAHHYSIVESGWLDVHLAIPAFKKYLMKNQMSIKYHWKVDKEYWGMAYGDRYLKADPAGKTAIKKEWLLGMNKSLTDVERSGNSIMTETTWDPVNKLYRDHITVTSVTDAMKDGKYIEDNLEAAANIFYALGIDPAIVGFAGGANQGARSGGSDKREAYLIALQMLMPFRDMLLEPLEFIADYNGWKERYPNLSFRFRDTILTTLDTGAGTEKVLS